MEQIANKLKNSLITLDEETSRTLLDEVTREYSRGDKIPYFSKMFNEQGANLFESFVHTFLHTQAFIESSDGTRMPTYDPVHVGYCKSLHPELGQREHWFGYYSNCVLLYTEFADSPEDNSVILFVDKETYEVAIKILENDPSVG